MTTPSLYRDGTITLVSESTAVVGLGTAWSTQVTAGAHLYVEVSLGGSPELFTWRLAGTVASVGSDTGIVLDEAFLGEGAEGANYFIASFNNGRDVLEVFRTLMTQLNGGGVNKNVNGVPVAADHRDQEFIRDRLSGLLYTKDQGVITPVTAPFATTVGAWASAEARFALTISTGDVAIDRDDGEVGADGAYYYSLTVDEAAEVQLPLNAEVGDVFDILFTQSGGGNAVAFAAGYLVTGSVRTLDTERSRMRFTVTEVAGSPEEATALTGAHKSYSQNDLVTDRDGAYISTEDDNTAEPQIDGSSDPEDSNEWIVLPLPQGDPGAQGDPGDTGPTGPNVGLDYQWSTATAGDPTPGYVRGNNADPTAIDSFAIDELDRQGENHDALIAFLSGSDSTIKATIFIIDTADRGNWLALSLTAAFVDETGYWTGAVDYVDHAGTLANDAIVSVFIARTGNKGADGAGTGDVVGPASSTNGAVAVFGDTSGKLLADGGVLDDLAFSGDEDDLTTDPSGLDNSDGVNQGEVNEDFDTVLTAKVAKAGDALTGGFTATTDDDGTPTTTYKPTPVGGNFKKIICGGALEIQAPDVAGDYTLTVKITNDGSAGDKTFSGFTMAPSTALFTNTDTHVFLVRITKVDGTTTASVEAMQ
jgi:hypothetical protein